MLPKIIIVEIMLVNFENNSTIYIIIRENQLELLNISNFNLKETIQKELLYL